MRMWTNALARLNNDVTKALSRAPSEREPRAARYLLAASFPVAAGFIAHVLSFNLGVVHVSFVFITSVICAGALFGVGPALLAAALAFGIYNFFLVEPRYSLQLATADDFITLLLFLVAAALTGSLAGRLREQVALSQRQLRTTQALLDASESLSREAIPDAIRAALARSAEQAIGAPAAVLDAQSPAGSLFASGTAQLQLTAADTELCLKIARGEDADAAPHFAVSAMHDREGRLIGALVSANGAHAAPGLDHRRTLDSLASLGAVAVERSLLASEMSRARALAETERLRSALLSSISHDFRTPLATIMASATSLIDYEMQIDADAKRELAQVIRDETEGLSAFVANLLEMTRLEAGELRPRLVEVDLADIAAEAIAATARNAQAAGVKIVHEGAPAHALADPVLLQRAIYNIVDNAITFSARGEMIALHTGISKNGEPTIAVTDEGPGIPAAMHKRIFEKFFRGDDHAGRKRGVGLGLSIALALVETMGGALCVESPAREGRGARFVITLPASSGKQP